MLLDADDNCGLPEPYAGLSEVCVTRRVYRSGESEYLINKIPCRLKDITEFFMAAQIHSRGYALIEQGRIEEIIQSKPTELRGMIEEAAGLSLFKGRREMSERKLERVRENLARVDDVLAEIDRQLAFARRQAKKAEAYKAIRLELGELERLSAARRLLEERARLEAKPRPLRGTRRPARSDSRIARRIAVSDRRGRRPPRGRARPPGRARPRARQFARGRRSARPYARIPRRRLGAADSAAPELAARLEELEAKATAARAARAEAGARLARAHNEEDGGEAALAALRERHEEAATALGDTERRGEDARDEVAELMSEAAAIRGRLGALGGERGSSKSVCARPPSGFRRSTRRWAPRAPIWRRRRASARHAARGSPSWKTAARPPSSASGRPASRSMPALHALGCCAKR